MFFVLWKYFITFISYLKRIDTNVSYIGIYGSRKKKLVPLSIFLIYLIGSLFMLLV